MVTKKVILADDTPAHRSLLKSSLKLIGPKVGINFDLLGEAEDGEKLLALFSSQPKGSIDIVFSDIRMPVMDGLSSLVKIRSLDPQQKIIMVSSENIQSMENANARHGEEARKTLEVQQRLVMLNKVMDRILKNVTEEGKTNSILTGCEKLALDPIWVAEQYGANGYLRKPYDLEKTQDLLKYLLSTPAAKFKAVG